MPEYEVAESVDPGAVVSGGVSPSVVDGGGGLVYVLGSLGYDFGTEARRDSFKQLMAPVSLASSFDRRLDAALGDVAGGELASGSPVPANPYDARQMVGHLERFPAEASALIWTLNLELTPVYALEPVGPYGAAVFDVLRQLLAGVVAGESADDFVERVSVPGRLSGRSVRLFSGQVVPVVEVGNTRGLYGWRVNRLIQTAVDAVQLGGEDVSAGVEQVRGALRGFLDRVYYDLRNLGVLSGDRALNFAATNAFQAANAFASALAVGMELDSIAVESSPYGRVDGDCWDVKLKFFDPENLRRARRVFRFTVDVSEEMPVTMGEVRSWSSSM